MLNGIRFARENNVPFLGTCSGFGYAVLEFARSHFGLETVHHPQEGLTLPEDQLFLDRLASCGLERHAVRFTLVEGTLAHHLYRTSAPVTEQSHCSYGIHPGRIGAFAERGLVVSARDAAGEAKILEYTKNDLFLLMLFYPQLNTRPQNPHPVLTAFLEETSRKSHSLVATPDSGGAGGQEN